MPVLAVACRGQQSARAVMKSGAMRDKLARRGKGMRAPWRSKRLSVQALPDNATETTASKPTATRIAETRLVTLFQNRKATPRTPRPETPQRQQPHPNRWAQAHMQLTRTTGESATPHDDETPSACPIYTIQLPYVRSAAADDGQPNGKAGAARSKPSIATCFKLPHDRNNCAQKATNAQA